MCTWGPSPCNVTAAVTRVSLRRVTETLTTILRVVTIVQCLHLDQHLNKLKKSLVSVMMMCVFAAAASTSVAVLQLVAAAVVAEVATVVLLLLLLLLLLLPPPQPQPTPLHLPFPHYNISTLLNPTSPPTMSSTPPPLTDDAIYFASIPVHFAPVPGHTIPFVPSEWQPDPSSLAAALARFSLTPPTPPNDGLPLFQPAIPALDFQHHPPLPSTPAAAASAAAAAALPPQLRSPLLKIPQSPPSSSPPSHPLQGYASGVRSALIKIDGQWYYPSQSPSPHISLVYAPLHITCLCLPPQRITLPPSQRFRLKGCGNNADGFIVKTERQNLAVDDGPSLMSQFLQVRVNHITP